MLTNWNARNSMLLAVIIICAILITYYMTERFQSLGTFTQLAATNPWYYPLTSYFWDDYYNYYYYPYRYPYYRYSYPYRYRYSRYRYPYRYYRWN